MNAIDIICPNAPGVLTPLLVNPGGALNCNLATNPDGQWLLRWWYDPSGLTAMLDVLCIQNGILVVAGDHTIQRSLTSPWVTVNQQDYSPAPRLCPAAVTPGLVWNYQDSGSWTWQDDQGNKGSGTYTHGSVGSYGGGLLTFHETETDIHADDQPPGLYDRVERFNQVGLILIDDNLEAVQYVVKALLGQ